MVEAATTEYALQAVDIEENTEVDFGEMPPELPPRCA